VRSAVTRMAASRTIRPYDVTVFSVVRWRG
jgi:hypothetical protein